MEVRLDIQGVSLADYVALCTLRMGFSAAAPEKKRTQICPHWAVGGFSSSGLAASAGAVTYHRFGLSRGGGLATDLASTDLTSLQTPQSAVGVERVPL